MTNDYNPTILLAWQGNMDMQYIGEKSTLLNWYIAKYTTKAECSHATTTFSDLTSNKLLASKLWNISLRRLSNHESGALITNLVHLHVMVSIQPSEATTYYPLLGRFLKKDKGYIC